MIKTDLKFMRLPLACYYALSAAYIFLLILFPELFQPVSFVPDVIKSTIFYFTDFLLPLLASCCIVLQLGNTLEKNTFQFLCTLPKNISMILRWVFTVALILPPYLISLAVSYFTLDQLRVSASFIRLLFISGPNLLFFCTAALLLIILFRQIFYTFCILCGYTFIDLFMSENLFREFSLFINVPGNYSKEVIDINRIGFCILSITMFLISLLLIKLKFLQRFNGKV